MEKKNKKLPVPINNQPAKNYEVVQTKIHAHSGPLPSPDILREYDNILPGAAERVFRMAESQQTHRQNLETSAISGDSRRAFCGLFAGVFVVLCVLVGSIYVIMNGHEIIGGILSGLDLVGLGSVFVYGTVSRRQERTRKAQIMSDIRSRRT